MPTDDQDITQIPPALEFKSSTFSVPVLVIYNQDLAVIQHELQKKIKKAPDFFKNSPIVFDLQWFNKNGFDLDIARLVNVILELGLLPIGIRGGSELQNKLALELRIPVYSVHNNLSIEPKKLESNSQQEPDVDPGSIVAIQSTLISQPVRSGQRIYAAGDLIILAQVSPGAEIIAEGNIHVYGTLRGRALAGVQGNTHARIYCSHLEAELVSIAGTYKISEDMRGISNEKPMQIYLQENTLIIKDIV